VFNILASANTKDMQEVKLMDTNNKEGKNKRTWPRYLLSTIGGGLLVFLLLTTLGRSTPYYKYSRNTPRLTAPQQQLPQVDRMEAIENADVITAAEKVIPSVVGITTIKTVDNRRAQGVGSGVIVDVNGYILTNNHVAGRDAEDIVVSLYDGRDVSATTVWTDPVLDMAIIKIDADGLKAATLGDSKAVRIGEQAIAIGNPLGLTFQRTVTAGIISAVNRTIEVSRGVFMEDLIQTDASINPGNSGGPLINIRGEVVGINTIKVTSAEAIGFAVPVNYVKPVIDRLKTDGRYQASVTGLQVLDKELGKLYNFVADGGVYVYDCKDGQCAFKAGIRKGDIILSVDGTPVNNALDFKEALNRAGAGKTVNLRIKTVDGIEKDVSLVLDGEK